MNRLGLLRPSELKGSQLECYNMMREYTTANYTDKFIYLDAEDRLVGPFGIQVHTPALAAIFIDFAKNLRTLPGLPSEVRECAILGVGSRLGAAYEEYAHQSLSGFSETDFAMLHSGRCPDHFSDAQKVAFDVAVRLGNPGPLDAKTWEKAVTVLGLDGATALIHYVAFYCYVSTILNGFDAKVPDHR